MSLKEKRWDESGKGDYAISYEDVKEAVLEFEKEIELIKNIDFSMYLILIQKFKNIFGDWKD